VMTNDRIDRDMGETLVAVARLLHHAAFRVWAQAEAEGPRSPLHLLGLGIHTASCQAVAMLAADADLEGQPPVQDDVAQLLRSAEELTRSIPVVDNTAGISPLVVAICDLVREVTP
jgi:NAD(P)-dependent dehydrogenase (short-subunit alcohol dehydrogenase family)